MKKVLLRLMIGGMLATMLFGVGMTVNAAETDVLRNKSALFAGDSITYGYRDSASAPRSWALRLQNNYGMRVTNKGQNGHSLSDVRDYTVYGNVDKRLHKKCFDTVSYDYVILQGGVNDIIGAEKGKGHPNPEVAVSVGSVAATKNPGDFDTSTFAGGLERYFYEATTRYPSARIGFIINYKTPNSTWGGNTRSADAYWQIARDICRKWNISYLDLYDDSYSIDVLKANTNTYLEDTLHLNAAGYNVIAPYIARWMATLTPYNSGVSAITTTSKKDTSVTSSTTTISTPTTTNNKVAATTTTAATTTRDTAVGSVADTKADPSSTPASSTTTTVKSDDTTQSTDESHDTETLDNTADTDNNKSSHTWLIVVLIAASVVAVATVIIALVRSRMQ